MKQEKMGREERVISYQIERQHTPAGSRRKVLHARARAPGGGYAGWVWHYPKQDTFMEEEKKRQMAY